MKIYDPPDHEKVYHPCPHCGGMKKFYTVKEDSKAHLVEGTSTAKEVTEPIRCVDCRKTYMVN